MKEDKAFKEFKLDSDNYNLNNLNWLLKLELDKDILHLKINIHLQNISNFLNVYFNLYLFTATINYYHHLKLLFIQIFHKLFICYQFDN